MNHLLIMAGGVGSRFWPISTPEFPKQFIDVLGIGRSLIQMTYDRFAGIVPASNVWVVTNAKYVDIVRQQLPEVPAANILAEPTARNTAPCIAWASWSIHAKDTQANIVVSPSDAVVMNVPEFQRIICQSLEFANHKNAIVTIGIKPNRAETGYGYVETNLETGEYIFPVFAFKEKPSVDVAEHYLKAGNFLWNAGIFVWNIRTIQHCIRHYKPNLANDMDALMMGNSLEEIFPKCEKISIDYAVMEPAAKDGLVYTLPSDFGWSDLGNWQSLHDKLEKDNEGNVKVGNVSFYESNQCLVHVENAKQVIVQGLSGYIIAEKNGRLLICKRSEEQRIKDFAKN